MIAWIGFAMLSITFGAADETPQSQYESLAKEFDAAQQSYFDASSNAASDEDRAKAAASRPDPRAYARKFLRQASERIATTLQQPK